MDRKILFLGLSLIATSAKAQHSFDHYEWDFGEIEETEGTVSHNFRLKNEGNTPLYITRAIPSCTCITAQLPQGAILPGKEGEVEVSFSPSGAVGETFRSVELTDQEGRLIGTLSIRADVTPIDRSIQERYFYTLGDMLYANLTRVPFGYIYPGDTVRKTVFLANASRETMHIETRKSSKRPVADNASMEWLQVLCPDSIGPGEELPMTLSYSIAEDSPLMATLHDTLQLWIDGRKALIPITTSAICLQRLTPSNEAPSLRTYPSAGRLMPVNDQLVAEIEIHNDGQGPLKILKIETPEGVEAQMDLNPIPAGGQTMLRVTSPKKPNATEASAKTNFRITIFTNDLKRQYREIEIKRSN